MLPPRAILLGGSLACDRANRPVVETLGAFGDGALYAERLVTSARHIEIQIVADGSGAISHLWERDCSLQRRHQKVVELAQVGHMCSPSQTGGGEHLVHHAGNNRR